jgi:hypothetical protein
MTLEDLEARVVEQKPKRPHRRTRPLERPAASPRGDTHPNGTPDMLAVMEARLAALERQQPVQYVPAAPPPLPTMRVASPESLTAFQAELAARARPTPKEIPRELPYNYPLRWYARPDGEIVQLQGDPQNRAMYQDLGFHLLDADEVARWEGGERGKAIALQRRKANIISAVRAFALRTPGYVLEPDMTNTERAFSDMSIDELEEFAASIEQERGTKIHIPRPRVTKEPVTPRDANLSGIEAGAVDARVAGLIDGSRVPNGRTIEAMPGRPLGHTL